MKYIGNAPTPRMLRSSIFGCILHSAGRRIRIYVSSLTGNGVLIF